MSVRGTGGEETRSNPRRSAAGLRPRRLDRAWEPAPAKCRRCGPGSTGSATQSAVPVLPVAGHPGWGRRDRAGSAAAAARRDNYI